MPGVCLEAKKKKESVRSPKLELQTAVSFHVGAGSRAFISEENALNNWAVFQPQLKLYNSFSNVIRTTTFWKEKGTGTKICGELGS